ncbi:MAG: amidohydrolase [Cyclobacteriaceae bacterium]|jgi:amidohydrolase
MEKTFINKLAKFRRELHRNPEVSQNEFQTKKRILFFLKEIGVSETIEVGNTGLICVFDSGVEGKTVLIRGDIDALPIQEINTFAHRSTVEGVSHKCGHDGHAAILCGLAKRLIKEPLKSGRALLLFQPAEENGEGAKAVIHDPHFVFKPDFVFALHNLPGYPLHQVVYKEGSFTAAAKSIILKLDGRTSHAAEPELGINPAAGISKLISMFQEVSNPDLSTSNFALATPIHIHMGELSYGISAGSAEVHYTLRTWNNEMMNQFSEVISRKALVICEEEKLKLTIDWTQEFSANQNHTDTTEYIVKAIEENKLSGSVRPYPFKWGEDFGLFTEKYKGAMFGIGSGEQCPALHNPDYDFPDALLTTGINMFYSILKSTVK